MWIVRSREAKPSKWGGWPPLSAGPAYEKVLNHLTKQVKVKAKPNQNLLLYSSYYTEACNEFAVPISASYRQGNTVTL